MKPCEAGHNCVWMRDAGTSYKCTFATCKVYVIDDEQGTECERKRQAKVDQMERDYRAGKLQFANRPYSYPKATPPPIPDKRK